MADENKEDRSLPASPRRIEQAREEGNLPRSRELVTAALGLSSLAALWMAGPWIWREVQSIMADGLRFSASDAREQSPLLARIESSSLDGLWVVSGLGLVLSVIAVLASLGVGGYNFSTKAIGFRPDRLNPLSGLGRLFAVDALAELAKALLKAAAIGGLCLWLLMTQGADYADLARIDLPGSSQRLFEILRIDLVWLLAPLIILAVLDVPFVMWRYYEQLKMTPEEAKREQKEAEGDPQIKARIRQLQRQSARRRMMAAIPTADVVVTNPSHYAVALRYQDASMAAPIVVAKGAGELALKIKAIADQHGVPQVRIPVLARALYRNVELEREVPAALYNAVAKLLAYVYQLKSWRQQGGPVPIAPSEVDVPAELDIPESERISAEVDEQPADSIRSGALGLGGAGATMRGQG